MFHCKKNCRKIAVRTLPNWCDVSKQNRTVSIDHCLLTVIETFWVVKIETLGNCCGHSKKPPSIILGHNCTSKQIILAKKIANGLLLNQQCKLMQWKLCNV